jgi:hypothetical protein
MTSARDILDDVYVPALERAQFTAGVFLLCRYSFRPFAAGLLASGMRARLLPFDSGDCRDYRTWLLADRGVKREQTAVCAATAAGAAEWIGRAAPAGPRRFERRGNVLHPVDAAPAG